MSAAEPGYDPLNDIRLAIEKQVLRSARAEGVEVRERQVVRGTPESAQPMAEPLAGIRYAVIARNASEYLARTYIRHARQDSLTWFQVGEALDLAGDQERDNYEVAAAAYEYAAGPARGFDRPSFHWSCLACGQYIADNGPYTANPWDSAAGHAEDCDRLAAEVAAYRAEWGDDE